MAAEPVRQYTDEIHDALGYWATWLPGSPLELGQCGPLQGRVFDPQSALTNFGIELDSPTVGQLTDIQYVTKGAVSYSLHGAADSERIPGIPEGKAGIKLSFSRENAIVFVAKDARHTRIADVNQLAKTLYELISVGEFPAEFAVITEIITAGTASIMISSSDGAQLSLSADADFSAGLIDVANASLGLSRVSSKNLQTEIVAQQSLTPLFKLVGLKRNGRFLRRKKNVGRLKFEDRAGESEEVGEVDPPDVDL